MNKYLKLKVIFRYGIPVRVRAIVVKNQHFKYRLAYSQHFFGLKVY